MSDLLASVLAVVQDELDAFWCFVGLMEDSVFVTSPKDDVMDRQLVSLFVLQVHDQSTMNNTYSATGSPRMHLEY